MGIWRPDEVLSEKDLVLPGITPTNFHLDPKYKATMITSDVYNICERLQELNPRLFVHYLEDTSTGQGVYCIMERTGSGEELVFKTSTLDGNVLKHVEYLLHVPLQERVRAAEQRIAQVEADAHEKELDELYERLGRQMWYQFEHDGFIEHRGVSYPKRGIKK